MYCLAIDIGASSGRHILGEYKNGNINMTEIYRFENGFSERDGFLSWDIEYLTKSVIEGIKKCREIGKIPKTVAIDTWGVDYVLLDKDDREILPAVAYRDSRTVGVPERMESLIMTTELYKITGIPKQNYNTVYQLFSDKETGKLENAECMLLMPEYLSYKLTGVKKAEYTIASTTALLNAKTRSWDMDLIKRLGFKPALFKGISMPGELVGKFSEEIEREVGFSAEVVFCPSHDTASAFYAATIKGHGMCISSGTWSLIGALNDYPVLTDEALSRGFTNEGGAGGKYTFIKNIMGMWLFQSIRRNLNKKYSYDEMMEMARKSEYKKTFDPNDERLVSPENMIESVRECLSERELPLSDVLSSVYHSLANSYARAVSEIEKITGEKIDSISIVGGGSRDEYLNELTALYTGKEVMCGPVEATAMGNLKTQLEFLGKRGS